MKQPPSSWPLNQTREGEGERGCLYLCERATSRERERERARARDIERERERENEGADLEGRFGLSRLACRPPSHQHRCVAQSHPSGPTLNTAVYDKRTDARQRSKTFKKTCGINLCLVGSTYADISTYATRVSTIGAIETLLSIWSRELNLSHTMYQLNGFRRHPPYKIFNSWFAITNQNNEFTILWSSLTF